MPLSIRAWHTSLKACCLSRTTEDKSWCMKIRCPSYSRLGVTLTAAIIIGLSLVLWSLIITGQGHATHGPNLCCVSKPSKVRFPSVPSFRLRTQKLSLLLQLYWLSKILDIPSKVSMNLESFSSFMSLKFWVTLRIKALGFSPVDGDCCLASSPGKHHSSSVDFHQSRHDFLSKGHFFFLLLILTPLNHFTSLF